MQDSDLDDLFATARSAAPQPGAALLARIETDALREQAARASVPVQRGRAAPAGRGFRAWIGSLGGGGALAGLACATLAGVWIGVAQPAPIATLTERMSGAFSSDLATGDPVELFPGFDSFATEG